MTDEKKEKKSMPLWALILCQLLLTGLVLCLFACAHHVIPRWKQMRAGALQPIGTVARQEEQTLPQEEGSLEPEQETAQEPEQPEPSPEGPESWQLRFSEHFSAEPTWTENGYSSPDLSVTVTKYKHTEDYPEATYYVADIYLADMDCFIVGFPAFGTYDDGERISAAYDGILAVNGDGMLIQRSGLLIRNGEIYNDTECEADLCVLYRDGSMECYAPGSYRSEEILAREPLHSWQFGPTLLDGEGRPLSEFNTTVELVNAHPRTALGYYEPGHYCIVVVDGRNPPHSRGMEMEQLAALMSRLGCRQAYNLDGGASSMMILNSKIISVPLKTGLTDFNRYLNDMLIFVEPRGEDEG